MSKKKTGIPLRSWTIERQDRECCSSRNARSTQGSVFWHLDRGMSVRYTSVSPMTVPGFLFLNRQLDQIL
jgi:hypothetical protein